jgi:formylglycine-generating enzyme required for sulfatase activity
MKMSFLKYAIIAVCMLLSGLQVSAKGIVYKVKGVKFTMVTVKGGTFPMGNDSDESNDNPVHYVKLSTFSIGQTEVTQELWEAVMGSNPSDFKGPKYPVESVSWDDCQTFIRKLNQLTGERFRLPTEAEWEYAARGGKKGKGYIYSGSNNLDEVAWYDGNSTHVVASKSPNELGIYDMSGNVWEWCNDLYADDFYSISTFYNPYGAHDGSDYVLRGGCWGGSASICSVTYRNYYVSTGTGNIIGFRLAL